MPKYKALMLDLDGTTIPNRRNGLPSQKVIEAVKRAQKIISVCVATGRPMDQAKYIIDILQIDKPVILLGGSQIIDGKSKEFIYERPLETDAITVLSALKPFNINIVMDEKYGKVDFTDSYQPKVVFNVFIKPLTETKADEIYKSISHINSIAVHKIVSWERGKVSINISHSIATKQHAIYEVARILGIKTNEIIGIGDGYNDFPLLMACGLKVAMGNAVSEIKAIADYVALSVTEDGVAEVIEKFILL